MFRVTANGRCIPLHFEQVEAALAYAGYRVICQDQLIELFQNILDDEPDPWDLWQDLGESGGG